MLAAESGGGAQVKKRDLMVKKGEIPLDMPPRHAYHRPVMILTLDDAARFLKLHRNTLYRFAQTRQVPAMKIGGQWRFDQAVLEQWIGRKMTINRRSP